MRVLRNLLLVFVVCTVLASRKIIVYILDMLSRDNIVLNYFMDRKSLINTVFCTETDRVITIKKCINRKRNE